MILSCLTHHIINLKLNSLTPIKAPNKNIIFNLLSFGFFLYSCIHNSVVTTISIAAPLTNLIFRLVNLNKEVKNKD